MEELKIAIVDDSKDDACFLKHCLLTYFKNADITLFTNAKDVLKNQTIYQFIILDIDLGFDNGIDASRQLDHKTGFIIYVTALKEKMKEAFGYKTIGYVLKTDSEELIAEKLKKLIQDHMPSIITLHTKYGDIQVNQKNIIRITKENRKIYCYVKNGKYFQLSDTTLLECKKQFSDSMIRISQSELVSFDNILTMHGLEILLTDGTKTYMSRRMKKEVYTSFLRRFL